MSNGNGSSAPVIRVNATDDNGQRTVIEMPGRASAQLLKPGTKAGGKRQTAYTSAAGMASLLSNGVVPRQLRAKDTFEILSIIRDLDPQVSQAVWNYLRLMNPGHDLRAYVSSGGSEKEEKGPAQDFLDELARRVGSEYGGGLDQLHNVLNLTLITKGAEALEVTPTADLRDVFDWYPVDPAFISFRREEGRLLLGQLLTDGKFEELNPDLVFHQPLDPDVNDPYGRLPILSVVNTIVTMATTLADIRATSHNQGYPRIDVSVSWETLLKAAPTELKGPGNEAGLMSWAAAELQAVVGEYENLQPDDTFVHYDFVDLKMVGGTAPASLAFNFKEFIAILDARAARGLKHLPILSGLTGTNSESHGSIEWQIQVAGIEALQRVTKRLIEKAANASLRLKGLNAYAKLTYREIRTVDRLYEAQSALFEAKAHQISVAMGWESNDEAAQDLFGHNAVAAPLLATPSSNSDINPNNSGDKTPGAAENGPGAGGDEVQSPKEVEKKASFDLLLQEMRDPLLPLLPRVQVKQRLADSSNELVGKYEHAAGLIFSDAVDTLVETLAREGIELRDLSKDVADYVFGLRYSRQMKALLRDSIAEGMRGAGVTEPEVPERIVRRIWTDNRQYINHIRDDLKEALRAGKLKDLEDVRAWFRSNAWREDLMGRYLAKQGLAAGFAFGRSLIRGETTRFQWALGDNDNHCGSCVVRAGHIYTHEELLSAGFPGSGSLTCAGSCHCSLVEVD